MLKTLFEPAPHEAAARMIRSKPAVSRAVFDGLLPELRARAFTVTGLEGANALQRVRDAIAGLPLGQTWEEAKASVADELAAGGFEGDAEGRAGVLLRTHAFQAFQAANWEVAQADADTTHLQYLATEDDRVRDSHLALNGLILPKDDPFWQDHYPPWEWGCRCRVRSINPDMLAIARAGDRKRNPEDRLVMEGPALDQLRNGTLMREGRRYDVTSPRNGPGGDRAFGWDPGSLRMPVEELRQRYDPEVWEEFMRWANASEYEPGKTVLEWMGGKNPIAVQDKPVLKNVADVSEGIPVSNPDVSTAQAVPERMTIYRAASEGESGIREFSSWTQQRATAEKYMDNPGFGGPVLRSETVPKGKILEVDVRSVRGMMDLAEKLGFDRETGQEWFENGWQYPWEESDKVRKALAGSDYDWVSYTDDFPQGATTLVPLKPIIVSDNSDWVTLHHGTRANIEKPTGIVFWSEDQQVAQSYMLKERSVGGAMRDGVGKIITTKRRFKNPLDLSFVNDRTEWWELREHLVSRGISREMLEELYDSFADQTRAGVPHLLDENWAPDAQAMSRAIREAGYDSVKITEDGKPGWITFD